MINNTQIFSTDVTLLGQSDGFAFDVMFQRT